MEVIIKLNNQTAGKDKVARLLQYLCRAVWDSLNQNELNIELIEKLKSLEYILSSFRKLLRFGKCLDVFYSSFATIHYPDVVVRTTLTLSKISSALYLLADHVIWLIRSGLFRNFDSKKWNTAANKYWLFSIVMNLCRDFYEILRLIDMRRNYRNVPTRPKKISTSPSLLALQAIGVLCEHKSVAIDTIKNLCDVFIPLTALGYTKFNPKLIGVLGAISSLAGLIAIIQPTAKLVPS